MGAARGVLLAVVLLCIASVGVWITHGRDGRAPAVTPSEPAPDRADPNDRDAVIHLSVLNGTGVSGLAGEVSLRLDRAGCVADRVANAPHDGFARTLLINRRLDDDRAAALAERLGGVRLLREFDARATEDAVLVLGADHDRLDAALRSP